VSVALRTLGVLVAFAALMAMAWASTAPLRVDATGDAIVRVSLGARPERIETCRTQSDEELAKVAPQMRQRVVCEGVTARYRLEVRRDRELLLSQVVRGGGLRHDRQLYVSRDLRVPPGPASFTVHITRIDTVAAERDDARDDDDDDDAVDAGRRRDDDSLTGQAGVIPGRAGREAEERRRRREEAIPAELELEIDAPLTSGEVLLISYDQDTRRLVARRDLGEAPR
jgi:hypothetical protein